MRKTIETERGRFDVIDEGKGSNGSSGAALVLVLVHGFPLSADSWAEDAAALARSGLVRVIAPSMRGFGGTPPHGELSIDVMADDVAAVLDALGVREPVVMGGLSMGGYVTLAFARRHPPRVRALVLCDTRAEPDGEEARANRDKAIARVDAGDLDGLVDGLLEIILSPHTLRERPEVVERVRAMMTSAAPAAVTAALRALRDRPDARPGLASIEVPALIVVGEDDALTPPADSHAMAAAMRPGLATVKLIARAGHGSNLEAPEPFRAIVADFVATLTTSAR